MRERFQYHKLGEVTNNKTRPTLRCFGWTSIRFCFCRFVDWLICAIEADNVAELLNNQIRIRVQDTKIPSNIKPN